MSTRGGDRSPLLDEVQIAVALEFAQAEPLGLVDIARRIQM